MSVNAKLKLARHAGSFVFSSLVPYLALLPQVVVGANFVFGRGYRQFTGVYEGTFGAISGCQEGSNITLTATVNGVLESGSALCPAPGYSTAINLTFGMPQSGNGAIQSIQQSNRGSDQLAVQKVNLGGELGQGILLTAAPFYVGAVCMRFRREDF